MTSSTINEPDNPIDRASTEEELRAEIERLTQQLEQKNTRGAHSALEHPQRPPGVKIVLLLLLVAAIFLVAFFVGYIPRHQRELQITAEASAQNEALPDVTVVTAKRASTVGDLVLPGNIQAGYGSAHPGARGRLRATPLRGYWRSRCSWAASGGSRSAGSRSAGSASPSRGGAGGGGFGARQRGLGTG